MGLIISLMTTLATVHTNGKPLLKNKALYVKIFGMIDGIVMTITNKNIPPELQHILETVPPEQIIAHIEALNPPWKHDLLPWQIVQPGEKIPWQAVYSLIKQEVTEQDFEWARQRLREMGLM